MTEVQGSYFAVVLALLVIFVAERITNYFKCAKVSMLSFRPYCCSKRRRGSSAVAYSELDTSRAYDPSQPRYLP